MASVEASAIRKLLRLLGYARPYIWLIVVTILTSLAYSAGDTARSFLLKPLMDDVVIPSVQADSLGKMLESAKGEAADPAELEAQRTELREKVMGEFTKIAFVGVLIILGMPALRLVRDLAGEWVTTRLFVDLQLRVGTRLLSLPLSRLRSGGTGDFVARVTSDTQLANLAPALIFGDAVQSAAFLITSLAAAFYLCWQLTLITLIIAPPVAIVFQIFGRRIRKYSGARQEQIAEVVQRLIQMISGIKIIKAFGTEGQEKGRLQEEVMRYFRRAMKVIRARIYSRSLVEFLTQGAFVTLLFVGIYAVIEQIWGLTQGTLLAYLFIVARLVRPVNRFTRVYNSIQDALPAADRIFQILDDPGERPDSPKALALERVAKGIRFRDVTFSYGREPVLEGVNLDIRRGEVVALVGRTGAGKTTMMDLLLGFNEPQSGAIEIDGVDLSMIKRSSLRKLIAVVTQEPFIFSTTLRENLIYGKIEASEEEMIAAAQAARIHDFIVSLPHGYDTPIGDLGGELSGGQRQRITIARAILRDPQILIFDEATSALDAHAEQQVQDAIWNLMHDRTVLLIAHRLSTVKAADRIAILEDGRITDVGTHEQLIEAGGLYQELVELQFS